METSPHILIVDDDQTIQEFVSMALEDEGYRVLTASDGSEALNLITQYIPSLILLDMRMPNIDGREFIASYHRNPPPHSPIIILTDGRNNSDTMMLSGTAGFLAKPFDLDDLLTLVSQYAHA